MNFLLIEVHAQFTMVPMKPSCDIIYGRVFLALKVVSFYSFRHCFWTRNPCVTYIEKPRLKIINYPCKNIIEILSKRCEPDMPVLNYGSLVITLTMIVWFWKKNLTEILVSMPMLATCPLNYLVGRNRTVRSWEPPWI